MGRALLDVLWALVLPAAFVGSVYAVTRFRERQAARKRAVRDMRARLRRREAEAAWLRMDARRGSGRHR